MVIQRLMASEERAEAEQNSGKDGRDFQSECEASGNLFQEPEEGKPLSSLELMQGLGYRLCLHT